MSTLFIFEFEEDFIYLKKLLNKNEKLIIVSTNYIVSNLLQKKKLNI